MASNVISLIKAIEACEDINDRGEGCLNYGYLDERHLLIQQVVSALDSLLVNDDGYRNYAAELDLEDAGYSVFCLEKDGFSWLVGGVQTNKGVIAYG
jgi:hypothetical protein